MSSGFLLINKPVGPSSHDIVNIARHKLKERKIGHAGTLDPLAAGLILLGVGREATRQLCTIGAKKTYVAEIKLGETSTTDDNEGVKHTVTNSDWPPISKVEQVLMSFLGETTQRPPAYSAIKTSGTPSYKLARRGHSVTHKPRPVTIFKIKLLSYTPPQVIIRTTVSSGTYIRALARDIGEKLGAGAYMSALTRTKIDNYTLADAILPEDIKWEEVRSL